MGRANVTDLEEVAEAAGRRDLQPLIGRTVPLDQAVAALVELETRHTPRTGKLVVMS